jgi:hypothetical protein
MVFMRTDPIRVLAAFLLIGSILSCSSTKKIPLERWEPGAEGRYEVSYHIGDQVGTAQLRIRYNERWTAVLYGAMYVPVFTADLGPDEWVVKVKGEEYRFPPCAFMDAAFIARLLNGDFAGIPSHFECQGFDFTWDLPSGRLAGIKDDGQTLYFIFSKEKPVYHISIEAVEKGLTLELVGKAVYRLEPPAK